nr:hypothetical protein [Treponemataceae bacterium]
RVILLIAVLIVGSDFLYAAKPNSFSLGGYLKNSYSTGEWSHYVLGDFGLGLDFQYNFPFRFSNGSSYGCLVNTEFLFGIPKSASIVESFSEFSITPGLFWRMPFNIKTQSFYFQLSILYGIVMNFLKTSSSLVGGTYIDQVLSFNPNFSWQIPKLDSLFINFEPNIRMKFEQSALLLNCGFNVGATYFFKSI